MNKQKNNPIIPEQIEAVEARKYEHIQISLSQNVEYTNKTTLFEDVVLFHNALPEINRDQVDTTTTFLGHKFTAPLLVTGMTGGTKAAEKINKSIARACEELGLGMGLGSMKAMIVDPNLTSTYQVRDVAPNIFLAGNIGANDLHKFTPEQLKKALKQIGANILAVHLNPAQELVQKEGKAEFQNVLKTIQKYSKIIPIFVKEVGQGISGDASSRLSKTKIKAIDIAGSGGTNWIEIEYLRQKTTRKPLQNWGIPTALSLILARKNTKLPLIASGGIRTGEDIVKSLILGANVAAVGLPTLSASTKSHEEVKIVLEQLIQEIGDIMFLLGAKNINELKIIQPKIIGKLKELI